MEIVYGFYPAEELNISEGELSRRLRMKPLSVAVVDRDSSPEGGARQDSLASPSGGGVPEGDGEGIASLIDKCQKRLLQAARCRFAWVRVPLSFPEEGVCLLEEIRVESRDLCKSLRDCREAVLMGVTLGIGADRLLLKLEKTAPAEHFITDALASAAAEALCDETDRRIREEIRGDGEAQFMPRYSPGYGDCSIEVQRPLLSKLRATATLGISLNECCFMTPVKSITAIMGIKK